MTRFPRILLLLLGLILPAAPAAVFAQEESVRPGINKPYDTVNVEQKVKQFEDGTREVVQKLDAILDACELKPGMTVADVGAGTGVFTRPFAARVAPEGKVFAVDITQKFLDHVARTCQEQKIENVECVLCTAASTELPPQSIDLAFTCDTYHHFEYPMKTLASIHQALRPGGRLIVIDFKKEEGANPKWVADHVRADKKTVIEEATQAGFKLIDAPDLMKGQHLLRFEKVKT
ncbi:MAG TPA: methyltransferase domain-containing protein [Thermoguttaceae bacterium]|nr:methyltransferase domain-containing protein [Thermoguttaceae bacterium]